MNLKLIFNRTEEKMPMTFWHTNESFQTFILQEALEKYHEKSFICGKPPILCDVGDVSINPEDDYIDLCISIIFATSNDGIERCSVDGVVSKYIASSSMHNIDGTPNNQISKCISYRKVHERTFVNKEFKANFIRFINDNVDFDITIRTQKLYENTQYTDTYKFSKSLFCHDREDEFAKVIACCKVLCQIAKENHEVIEQRIERAPYKEKLIQSMPIVKMALKP